MTALLKMAESIEHMSPVKNIYLHILSDNNSNNFSITLLPRSNTPQVTHRVNSILKIFSFCLMTGRGGLIRRTRASLAGNREFGYVSLIGSSDTFRFVSRLSALLGYR